MHEISLVENIIDIVSAEMRKYNITKVNNIKLRIGEMSHVVPDALIFAFGTMSKDTSLEDAELIIERIPTSGRCNSCNTEFVMKDILEICPKCGGTRIDIISGKELEIAEFEGN